MIGIFLDLDGTLLNSGWDISEEDKEFLKSIKDKHNIYLITGSSYSGALRYYKELELDTWFVTSQGQEVSKPNENIFNNKTIDKKHLKEFIKIKNNCFFIEANNGLYKTKDFDFPIRIEKKELNTIEELDGIINIVSKIKPPSSLDLKYYKWTADEDTVWYVIHNNTTDKSTAVESIIKLDNLSRTIYIGDGGNDIEAMKVADISIAMKNSYDEVQRHATFISEYSNNESGVSRSLKKLLMKEEKNEL